MYIDISSVDELMKSTLEKKLFLNNKNYSVSFYILEKAAASMLDHVKNRTPKFGELEIIGSTN